MQDKQYYHYNDVIDYVTYFGSKEHELIMIQLAEQESVN